MMFKKTVHAHKQPSAGEKPEQNARPKMLTPEQLHQISLEMSWASEMMPSYSFPAGLWYLY